MKIEIFSENKSFRLYFPLSRFALKAILKLVIRSKKKKEDGAELTAEETASLVDFVDCLIKGLKDHGKKYGKWTLLEVREAGSGEGISIQI